MRRTNGLLLTAVLLLGFPGRIAAEDSRLDYRAILRQIADLDRLPYLEEGVVSRQFSSYHRGSRYDREKGVCVGMDINGDAGFYMTVHAGPEAARELEEFGISTETRRFAFGDLEWVLDPLERNHVFFVPRKGVPAPDTKPPEGIVSAVPGPGCIYRIWSANPMGRIRFYFDGSTEPMEFDFKGLFLKGAKDPDAETLARRREWPFIRPFTFRRTGDQDTLASDCYLPIPFAKSCIITLDRASFYQFGYKTYPEGTRIETFRLPLTGDEDEVLADVARRFLERGKDPKPRRPGTSERAGTVSIGPGEEHVIADLSGPGVVQALHARLESRERYAHSKVLLRAFFDGETAPSIWSPLVNFFGTGFEPRDYRSYVLGYINGEGYCYFPMPFRQQGRFLVKNEGRLPARLSYRIVHAPVDDLPPNTMHFKCKYRREEVCRTFDYPFLECLGAGRFCGAALCIDDAWRSWWGEGDEKIWVDDDVFPSFFGTGSEDYFGDAWGIRELQETFFACSSSESNRDHAWTCCYRYMVPDDVPFRRRFRATIENYPETIWGTQAVAWDEDYVSTAYWYQMPGGSDFFEPVPVEKRRPWGKVVAPPSVEAEDVLPGEAPGRIVLIDDQELDRELCHGAAVDLGTRKPGETVSFLGPEVILEGPYTVVVHTLPGLEGAAAFELSSGDMKIGTSPPDHGRRDSFLIGAGVFSKGRPRLTIRFTSAGRAVFDCFQLRPARQIPNAFEAEKARVLGSGGREWRPEIGIEWSGGRQILFDAAGPGDALELEVTVPAGNWNLVAGHTRGPEYGDYRVFVNGKEAGDLAGFAPSVAVKDGAGIGVLKGRNGTTRLRFVSTGKHEKARGYRLGLDYIGWARIVVEGAIEGETAEVVEVRGGRFVDQRLGPRWSGEAHLWFHPEKAGASFVWPLEVKEEGTYALAVYFTRSWDYAIVRVSLDGKVLGELDTYAPTVVWGGKTDLGLLDLRPGTRRLRFEIAGRNEKSAGILMGIDCITFEMK